MEHKQIIEEKNSSGIEETVSNKEHGDAENEESGEDLDVVESNAVDDGTMIIYYPGEPAHLEISDGDYAGLYEAGGDKMR